MSLYALMPDVYLYIRSISTNSALNQKQSLKLPLVFLQLESHYYTNVNAVESLNTKRILKDCF